MVRENPIRLSVSDKWILDLAQTKDALQEQNVTEKYCFPKHQKWFRVPAGKDKWEAMKTHRIKIETEATETINSEKGLT